MEKQIEEAEHLLRDKVNAWMTPSAKATQEAVAHLFEELVALAAKVDGVRISDSTDDMQTHDGTRVLSIRVGVREGELRFNLEKGLSLFVRDVDRSVSFPVVVDIATSRFVGVHLDTWYRVAAGEAPRRRTAIASVLDACLPALGT